MTFPSSSFMMVLVLCEQRESLAEILEPTCLAHWLHTHQSLNEKPTHKVHTNGGHKAGVVNMLREPLHEYAPACNVLSHAVCLPLLTLTKHDFPTPASPITQILKSKSCSMGASNENSPRLLRVFFQLTVWM